MVNFTIAIAGITISLWVVAIIGALLIIIILGLMERLHKVIIFVIIILVICQFLGLDPVALIKGVL